MRSVWLAGICLAAGLASACGPRPDPSGRFTDSIYNGEWVTPAGDVANMRYSPLGQINASSAAQMGIAWRWNAGAASYAETPIYLDDVLYAPITAGVAALDPATGAERWRFAASKSIDTSPAQLASWSDGRERRVFVLTGDAQLISLDAATGKPDAAFADKGAARLGGAVGRPLVAGDVVVVAQLAKDESLRLSGLDARTGAAVWAHPGKDQIALAAKGDPWFALDAKDDVFVAAVGDALVAVKAASGEEIWRRKLGASAAAAPVLYSDVHDGARIDVVLVLLADGSREMFNRADGEALHAPLAGAKLAGAAAFDPDAHVLFAPTASGLAALGMDEAHALWQAPAAPGVETRSDVLALSGLLVVSETSAGARLKLIDKITGATLSEAMLPASAAGAPMTFFHYGTQFLVLGVEANAEYPAGLVALHTAQFPPFAIPDEATPSPTVSAAPAITATAVAASMPTPAAIPSTAPELKTPAPSPAPAKP